MQIRTLINCTKIKNKQHAKLSSFWQMFATSSLTMLFLCLDINFSITSSYNSLLNCPPSSKTTWRQTGSETTILFFKKGARKGKESLNYQPNGQCRILKSKTLPIWKNGEVDAISSGGIALRSNHLCPRFGDLNGFLGRFVKGEGQGAVQNLCSVDNTGRTGRPILHKYIIHWSY